VTEQPWGEYQYEIYIAGIGEQKPGLPVSVAELEARAYEAMREESRGYIEGGAGAGDTMRANLEAFRRWRIVPRMLRDISARDLSVSLFGKTYATPLLLAPIGVQSLVHDEAEVEAARGAAKLGVPIVLSTASSRSIEEVA
jgi:lactate 2-monooxygenase